MSEVISLKSGKKLGGNNYKQSDEIANTKGEYIGMLPLTVAKELRELQDNLNIEEIQINQLIEEFEGHYKQYLYEIGTTLKKYNYIIYKTFLFLNISSISFVKNSFISLILSF
ncbi:hypothetical protein [Clostridium tagluense]|uniref:hypothetical protein n=1 Tax=Clostridium tagluense TaxID=360422 RepID=UPI001CF40DAF|nr:hypothetical protein [Clostridium tagluense]MCB2300144.1 hypothetical protein [Clostridium tagluense]